jgi:oligopeptide/dipeptide ABC transporter ATP-binding protein
VTDEMTSTIERADTGSRTGPPALTLRGVAKTFGHGAEAVTALRGIDLHVEPGEFVCLLGASGCGKSTLLNLVAGLDEPTAGDVSLGTARPSFMFQEAALLPWLTARRNVELPLQLAGLGRRERRQRADELLSLVRLKDQGDKRPHELSGGMRQRVMIAIALSCDPKLLIADEPTTALDVTVQASVLDLLDDLRTQHDMAMIIITHDMGVVAEAADDIVVMYAGQIVEHASTLDLFDHPEHPYTEALLGALPQLEGEGIRERRLTAIPGRPPDLIDPPVACRFAARCRYAGGDSCTEQMPELREVRKGHWVRSAHPASERVAPRAPEATPA